MKTVLLPLKFLAYNISGRLNKALILPVNYTYSLTSECRSRCKTCMIWRQRKKDLTKEEWKRIVQSIGNRPYWITITGGNPFLRKDFNEIMEDVICYNKPRILNFPISGSMPDNTLRKMERLLPLTKQIQVIANISMDGEGEVHDRLRGRLGDFENSVRIFKGMQELQKRYNNLSVCTYTVLSRHNIRDFKRTVRFLKDELKPDNYSIEIAEHRKELCNLNGDFVLEPEQRLEILEWCMSDSQPSRNIVMGLKKHLKKGYYGAMRDNLLNGTMRSCYAGIASIQISSDGKVWQCSTRAEVLGDLCKEDFNTIFFGKKAEGIRKRTRDEPCSCGLTNSYYTSTLSSLRVR
jgi:sulfatase maturation enzyme AslB (radical SAM superfamily)